MLGTQHLELFVLSGILLNLTPGQDTLYIVGRTMSQGRRAGVLSVLGISTGSVLHTLAAAVGLSAILATSAAAFTVVKLAGAAYLVYLGARMLLSRASDPLVVREFGRERPSRIYGAALLTNVLNPKVAVFFLAFLPQFVHPATESRLLTLLFLGGVFIFNGTIWCFVLVWLAEAISNRLGTRVSARHWVQRATGAVFVGLGVRLATSK